MATPSDTRARQALGEYRQRLEACGSSFVTQDRVAVFFAGYYCALQTSPAVVRALDTVVDACAAAAKQPGKVPDALRTPEVQEALKVLQAERQAAQRKPRTKEKLTPLHNAAGRA